MFRRNLLRKVKLRHKRNISAVYLSGDVGFKNETSYCDVMLQVEEPYRCHVSNDVTLDKRLRPNEDSSPLRRSQAEAVKETDRDPDTTPADDKSTYVIIQPEETAIIDVTTSLLKCHATEHGRLSSLEDSDYDEVLEFVTSLQREPAEVGKIPVVDDVPTASKRSSSVSTCTTSSGLCTSSGIESGEDRPASKYAQLDIAKILHTRKRIHQILQVPVVGAKEPENEVNETQSGPGKKKLPSRRSTHYATVRNARTRSFSAFRRSSSLSRPPSTGDDCYNNCPPSSDCSTLKVRGTPKDGIDNQQERRKSGEQKEERLRLRDSGSEEDGEVERDSGGSECKRWSHISSCSQNSDKIPQRGPWKAFRKLVYSSKQPSHEDMKATIHLCHNANNNNPKVQNPVEEGKVGDGIQHITHGAVAGKSLNPQLPNVSSVHAPGRRTNSLLRRFSRRSRDRSPRRKSLPAETLLNTAPSSDDPPRFRYGDGSRGDIEAMVMHSMETRVKEESQVSEKSTKPKSFRKRIMSFTRRRSASRERKSILRTTEHTSPSPECGPMKKTLSYSSPQLSLFAVAPGPQANKKLVF